MLCNEDIIFMHVILTSDEYWVIWASALEDRIIWACHMWEVTKTRTELYWIATTRQVIVYTIMLYWHIYLIG